MVLVGILALVLLVGFLAMVLLLLVEILALVLIVKIMKKRCLMVVILAVMLVRIGYWLSVVG